MTNRRLLLMGFALHSILLSGCSSTIDVSFENSRLPGIAAVPGAERVRLDVVARDARVQFKDRVGTLRHNAQKIVANNDVADLVRSSVEQLFKDQGFTVAAGGLIVTTEVQNFYFDSNFGSTSSVIFTLRARDLTGRTLYSHGYEGSAEGGLVGALGVGEKAKRELKAALDDALRKVNQDTSLQRALLSSSAQSVPATPNI